MKRGLITNYKVALFSALLSTSLATAEPLRFAWPTPLNAEVDHQVVSALTLPSGRTQKRFGIHYSLRVEAEGDHYALRFDDVTLDQPPETDPVQRFLRQIASSSAGYLLSPDGELVQLLDFEKLRADLEQSFETMVPFNHPHYRALKRKLPRLLDQQQLLTDAKKQWQTDIGQWVEAGSIGAQPLAKSIISEIPSLMSFPAPLLAIYRRSGEQTCSREGKPHRCLQLEVSALSDADEIQSALETFFAKHQQALPAELSLSVSYTVNALIEAETLLPHRIRSVQIIELQGENGLERSVESRTTEYRYQQ